MRPVCERRKYSKDGPPVCFVRIPKPDLITRDARRQTINMTFRFAFLGLAPLGFAFIGCGAPEVNVANNAAKPAKMRVAEPLPASNSVVEIAGVKTQMRSYASAQGYTIKLPLSWKMDFKALGSADLVCQAPAKPGAPVPNFNVVVTDAPKLTLDEVEKQIGATYPRQFAGYLPVSRSRTQLDGLEALSNAVSYQLGKPPRRFALQQLIALRNGKAYTFTATIPQNQVRQFAPLISAMLASVRWAK